MGCYNGSATRLQRRKKTGIYYCRAGVPKVLQPAIGKREILISLRTSDPKIALERIKAASAEVDRLFAQASNPELESQAWSLPDNILNKRIPHLRPTPVTFGDLVERFTNLPEKQALGRKTKLEYRITFRLFTEVLGKEVAI